MSSIIFRYSDRIHNERMTYEYKSILKNSTLNTWPLKCTKKAIYIYCSLNLSRFYLVQKIQRNTTHETSTEHATSLQNQGAQRYTLLFNFKMCGFRRSFVNFVIWTSVKCLATFICIIGFITRLITWVITFWNNNDLMADLLSYF